MKKIFRMPPKEPRSGFNILPVVRIAFSEWCNRENAFVQGTADRIFARFLEMDLKEQRRFVLDGAEALDRLRTKVDTADRMNEKKAASDRRGPRGKSSTDDEE